MVITVTLENFEKEVLKAEKTVVLDFWATWCGPCRMFTPIIEKFSADHSDVVVGKVNVDEQSELASQYNIMSIPTLVVIKNGEVVKKATGVISQEEIEAMIS